MSIPVRAAGRTSTTEDATAAGSDRHETRAELDPAIAEDLETIASDGDDAIRQLNSCIDSYNDVRDKFNWLREGGNVQAK
jgi:prophage endopeptidase